MRGGCFRARPGELGDRGGEPVRWQLPGKAPAFEEREKAFSAALYYDQKCNSLCPLKYDVAF